MFIYDFITTGAPLSAVRSQLQERGMPWLGSLAQNALGDGDRLLVRIGPGGNALGLTKQMRIDVGAAQDDGERLTVPMYWTPKGFSAFFPTLEANVEFRSLGDAETHIVLRGQYRPPLGPVGHRVDRLLLHRVAEACARAFLTHLADALARSAPPVALSVR